MLRREFYKKREDGVNLYITYSDENFKILQNETQIIYDEAIDIEDSPYTYTETDIPIEPEPEPESEHELIEEEENENN